MFNNVHALTARDESGMVTYDLVVMVMVNPILLSARVFSPPLPGRNTGRGPAKIIHPIVELDCG